MTIHAERISAMYERAKVIEKNRLDVSFSGDTIVRTWPDFVQIPTATDSQENRREPRVRGLLTHELVQDHKIMRILQQANVTLDCVLEKNKGVGYRITGSDQSLGRHADALIEALMRILPPDQMRCVNERYLEKLEETVALRVGSIQLGGGKIARLLKDGSIEYPADMTIDDADTLYAHIVNHAYAKPGVAHWFQVDKKPSALATELCKSIQEKTMKGATLTVAEQLYQTHGVKSLVRFGVGTLGVQQAVDPIILVKDPVTGNLKVLMITRPLDNLRAFPGGMNDARAMDTFIHELVEECFSANMPTMAINTVDTISVLEYIESSVLPIIDKKMDQIAKNAFASELQALKVREQVTAKQCVDALVNVLDQSIADPTSKNQAIAELRARSCLDLEKTNVAGQEMTRKAALVHYFSERMRKNGRLLRIDEECFAEPRNTAFATLKTKAMSVVLESLEEMETLVGCQAKAGDDAEDVALQDIDAVIRDWKQASVDGDRTKKGVYSSHFSLLLRVILHQLHQGNLSWTDSDLERQLESIQQDLDAMMKKISSAEGIAVNQHTGTLSIALDFLKSACQRILQGFDFFVNKTTGYRSGRLYRLCGDNTYVPTIASVLQSSSLLLRGKQGSQRDRDTHQSPCREKSAYDDSLVNSRH